MHKYKEELIASRNRQVGERMESPPESKEACPSHETGVVPRWLRRKFEKMEEIDDVVPYKGSKHRKEGRGNGKVSGDILWLVHSEPDQRGTRRRGGVDLESPLAVRSVLDLSQRYITSAAGRKDKVVGI